MKKYSGSATESVVCLQMKEVKRHRSQWKRPQFVTMSIIWIACTIFLCVSLLGGIGRKCRTSLVEHASGYGQIYQYYMDLLEKQDRYVLYDSSNLSAVMCGTDALGTASTQSMASADTSVQAYTPMNLREKKVGEADHTVTDGKRIYTLTTDWEKEQNYLHILEPKGKKVKTLLKMQLPLPRDTAGFPYKLHEVSWPENGGGEIYIRGDVLVITMEVCGTFKWDVKTAAYFYDISDITHPREIRHTLQNGKYHSIRECDGVLYFVTQRTNVPVTAMKKSDTERYIPESDGKRLALDRIILPEDAQGNAYTMISSWKLQGEIKKKDIIAVVGQYPDIYMTENNLYLSAAIYADVSRKEENDQSRIIRFRLQKGKIAKDKTVIMPGAITSSFGIQERQNKLYVVTQVLHYKYYDENESYEDSTDVCAYVFDDGLKLLSEKSGIARDEEIKAVRFLGDMGYIVSYKETDPLIGIDFSEPKKLQITDELKLPGFSTYLHPAGEDRLLGLGRSENREMKIALYDIKDNSNIKLVAEDVIKNIEESDAETDYRKVFFDAENKIVGLGGECYRGDDSESHYVLYHYEKSGSLKKIADYEIPNAGMRMTGIRIGNWFYILPDGEEPSQSIQAFSYK